MKFHLLFALVASASALAAPLSRRCDTCEAAGATTLTADIALSAQLVTTLQSAVQASAYAQATTTLSALLDVRSQLSVYLDTATGDQLSSCQSAIATIDANVDVTTTLVANLLVDIRAGLTANTVEVVALLKVLVDLRGALAAWIQIGAAGCSDASATLEAQIVIIIQAYLSACNGYIASRSEVVVQACITILAELQVVCTANTSLWASVQATARICAKANVELAVARLLRH